MSEADRLNLLKIRDRSMEISEGDEPGLRKRSFHRALQSGKLWALMRHEMDLMMVEFAEAMFFGSEIS